MIENRIFQAAVVRYRDTEQRGEILAHFAIGLDRVYRMWDTKGIYY